MVKITTPLKTHNKIAEEAGISPRQVVYNEEFSKGVDKLEGEYKQKVLQGQAKVNKQRGQNDHASKQTSAFPSLIMLIH